MESDKAFTVQEKWGEEWGRLLLTFKWKSVKLNKYHKVVNEIYRCVASKSINMFPVTACERLGANCVSKSMLIYFNSAVTKAENLLKLL